MKMAEYKNIQVEINNHVALVTIDHPPANAWNLATMEEFKAVIEKIAGDPAVRVLVLTGGGDKCFSAGFDVSDGENMAVTSPMGRALWTQIDTLTKPTIAAINGHALGGGLELALCCHFRLVVDKPELKIGLTELNLGILPGWGGTQRLARLVGRDKALEMILLSQVLGPKEALDAGLVNSLSPPERLLPDAMDLAGRLAERPPIAVSWVLKAMSAGDYSGMAEGLELEEQGSAAVRTSKDREEGFKAFLEKRKPRFTGE
jgi:enoyl-CoA hydratase/carnithine racemase